MAEAQPELEIGQINGEYTQALGDSRHSTSVRLADFLRHVQSFKWLHGGLQPEVLRLLLNLAICCTNPGRIVQPNSASIAGA